MSLKPVLIVIAGANGAGKTTITQQLLKYKPWIQGLTMINPDVIAQERFNGWNDRDSILKAAQYAQDLRYQWLDERKSFGFETVMSSSEKIAFLKLAKKKGYFIRLLFVGTNSPTINAARVARRVMNGGHTVPIDKIISRYKKCLSNLEQVLNQLDRVYLYDNSIDEQLSTIVARFQDGVLVKKYTNNRLPDWIQGISGLNGLFQL